ncbi:hypothetical protein [Methylobacterium sp. 190mf]|uniref:hypothetical protein n=1 Tax=Methylobacterium sp. 190mf TaxID=1761798 RepID=UPI0011B0D3CC|nr:hypothetical protein [Methylobacterium sp. 190mf]
MVMQLKIIRVHSHGDVGNERVWMKVTGDCDLSDYAVFDSTYDDDGNVSNKNRHVFWFPSQNVETGDFVSLRTGKGKDKTLVNDDGNTVHRFHWGLGTSVWNDDGDVATLVRINEWVSNQVK